MYSWKAFVNEWAKLWDSEFNRFVNGTGGLPVFSKADLNYLLAYDLGDFRN